MKQNYATFPKSMYGLNPTQLDMFMTEDSPMKRQSELVTEVRRCPLQSVVSNWRSPVLETPLLGVVLKSFYLLRMLTFSAFECRKVLPPREIIREGPACGICPT